MQEVAAAAGSPYVFLDMQYVETTHNVVHTVVEAEKHPSNPLLPLGDVTEWDSAQARPWESRTIIYDEEDGLFKCWYTGTDLSTERWWATGYAISEDGITWAKPKLGLHEWNGSKDNNICFYGWGPIIKDDDEPDPGKRYKGALIFVPPGQRRPGVNVGYSGDGIHWTKGPRIDLPEWNGGAPDIVVLLKDDQDADPQRRYKMVWQSTHPSNKPGPERIRTKSLACGPDVEHLVAGKANPILHPNDGLEQENHFLMLAPYHGYWVMPYEYGWYMPNATGNYGSYCADIRLAVSRDGEVFQRVNPTQKLIPRGRRGEWDDGFLVICERPVIKGDIVYLYYAGNGEEWTSWPGGNTPKDYRFASTGCVRLSRMGLATLRLDGFTCLETADRETPGCLVTKPIEVSDRNVQLLVNVSDTQQNRSWLQVEVLDACTDEPIPGFAIEDCVPVCRDGLNVPVAWRETALADLGASRVKLRFHLRGAARLYAFGFTTPS